MQWPLTPNGMNGWWIQNGKEEEQDEEEEEEEKIKKQRNERPKSKSFYRLESNAL